MSSGHSKVVRDAGQFLIAKNQLKHYRIYSDPSPQLLPVVLLLHHWQPKMSPQFPKTSPLIITTKV